VPFSRVTLGLHDPSASYIDCHIRWVFFFFCCSVNQYLTVLELWRNKFDEAGAVCLGDMLRVNATLTTLDLDKTKIGDSGTLALAAALRHNTTLTSLTLGGTHATRIANEKNLTHFLGLVRVLVGLSFRFGLKTNNLFASW
jgi:hypothetical protein